MHIKDKMYAQYFENGGNYEGFSEVERVHRKLNKARKKRKFVRFIGQYLWKTGKIWQLAENPAFFAPFPAAANICRFPAKRNLFSLNPNILLRSWNRKNIFPCIKTYMEKPDTVVALTSPDSSSSSDGVGWGWAATTTTIEYDTAFSALPRSRLVK